ncbi:response regulator [Marinibaculum pumilum]|uniref:histidine kinase n=1 Tax=Marinibaculum pumilum TaxID=1766165 RepID=A0ABV7L0F2_9PROT
MDDRKKRLRERLLATFRLEAGEHLQTWRRLLAGPEHGPEAAEHLFRTVHTLKGASRSVGLADIEQLCQQVEGRLSALRGTGDGLDADLLTALEDAAARVSDLLAQALEAGPGNAEPKPQEAAGPAANGKPVPAPAEREAPEEKSRSERGAADPQGDQRIVRVLADELDGLLHATEEFLPLVAGGAERVAQIRTHAQALSACRRLVAHAALGSTEIGARLDEQLAELERQAGKMRRDAISQSRALAQAYAQVAEQGHRIRVVPAWTVIEQIPRAAEELARSLGKTVSVRAAGLDIEMDRRILEALKDPLLHAVRNAVDHGIETDERRLEAGKGLPAKVTIAFRRTDDGRIEARVEDDGAGIDPEAVRKAAARARLASAERLELLDPDQALQLVFRSGLSTSPVVSQISGHGLGLAILRDRVEDLKGDVHLESEFGRGTRLTIAVPASIAIFRVLQVQVQGRSFGLPAEGVAGAFRTGVEGLRQTGDGLSVQWGEGSLPVVPLAEVLGLQGDGKDSDHPVRQIVAITAADRRLGLLVDAVEGETEVLFKPLRPPLRRLRHISGAGMRGAGDLLPVLRPSDLVRSWLAGDLSRSGLPGPVAPRRLAALVVDDSATTRVMEQHLLEAAGYDVHLAADGVEALEVLRSRKIDFVISDIDMPRLDGFELTRRIRAEPQLADLPVILVTALEGRADREAGMQAGANAYVTKSDFDQTRLLDIVGRLV